MSSSRRLPSDFGRSAAYPLFSFDPAQDRAWVLHFERQDYLRAGFLDQRALHHREVSGWAVSRAELEDGLDVSRPLHHLHWLFHIGHCGSTLTSRLLDLVPGVLGLREPLPLLTLASHPHDSAIRVWRDTVLSLLARGFEDTRAVVVKPTSVVTTIADQLLPHSGKACLLWVDLRTWLATMLRGNELAERVFATETIRLDRTPFDRKALPSPSRLARAWLAEQWRWRRWMADPVTAPRLLDMDFAELLSNPGTGVARLATHYGLCVPSDWDERIVASGLLGRYAKDEVQRFDADTRARELATAAQLHAGPIAEGLAWAEAALTLHGLEDLAERLRPGALPS